MKKLDVEMKRTDSLLYQMIPKTVADRLRKGEPAVNTCEVIIAPRDEFKYLMINYLYHAIKTFTLQIIRTVYIYFCLTNIWYCIGNSQGQTRIVYNVTFTYYRPGVWPGDHTIQWRGGIYPDLFADHTHGRRLRPQRHVHQVW